MSPFMAGKLGDHRERDMQHSEPLRGKLMRLYEQWDEALAVLRQRAVINRKNIKLEISQLRQQFDSMRHRILYGDGRVEQLEMYFKQYVTEIEAQAGTEETRLIVREARKELDTMITDIINRPEKLA